MGHEEIVDLKWFPMAMSNTLNGDNLDYTVSMELRDRTCNGLRSNVSCPEFEITMKRNSKRYMFQIVLPTSLLVVLSWASLSCVIILQPYVYSPCIFNHGFFYGD